MGPRYPPLAPAVEPQTPQWGVPTRRGASHFVHGATTSRPQPSQFTFAPTG